MRAAVAHEDAVVRQQVAARPHLPPDVTAALLRDDHKEVRGHLAAFTADPEALAILVRDPRAAIRARATENPSLTPAQLEALVTGRPSCARA